MNELTTLLDELESEAATAPSGVYPQVRPRHFSSATLHKLVAVMQEQGGEMGRLASVIEGLVAEREEEDLLPQTSYNAMPKGNMTAPDGKRDLCTRTAGNGVMTGGAF
jgi:hypothetical protein